MSDQPASRETELKFELTPQALGDLQQHRAFLVDADSSRLRSTYFDTPDHDLRTAGVSLRVRNQNGGFVQTVKRRKGSSGVDRDEWETGVAGESPEPAAYAKTPVAGILEQDGPRLQPVFATIVDRAVRIWREGNNLVEVSVDQGEVNAEGQCEPIRELELELKAGEPSALFALARDLATATPVRLSFASKADRGYRLAGHDRTSAVKAEKADLSTELTAGEVFRRIAWTCLMQAEGNASLLRRARSPEALHQARVAVRRLRAAASAFKAMLADAESAAVKVELKWFAGELDEARDLDVFIARAFPTAGEGDDLTDEGDRALAAFRERMLEAQAKAYDRALAAIESVRFSTLLLDVAAWLSIGEWTRSDEPLARAAREEPGADFGGRALDRLIGKVLKKGKDLKHLDADARHELRIRVKKLRYGAEFFLPIAGEGPAKRRRRFIEALKLLQEQLGGLNDIAVAREVALKAVGRRSPEMAFTAGQVVARQAVDEAALLKAAVDGYGKLKRAKRPWTTAG